MKENNSWAYEILHDLKRQNKRWFIVCIIELLIIISMFCYTLYLVNDIGYTESTKTQEIYDIDTIENSSITNGD